LEKIASSLPEGFEGLVALVGILRSEEGCPWDRQQTPEQIKMYLLEEAYELLEALESENAADVCAELGDLLFHVVFLARFYEEAGAFTIKDVIAAIREKMVRRHPHVFGQAKVSSAEDVRQRWHEIKMAEAKENGHANTAPFVSVPHMLPALMRAYRIGERASKLGFHRLEMDRLLKTLDQGLNRLRARLKEGNDEGAPKEIGDFLFNLVHVSRGLGVHPEAALTGAVREFIQRCEMVEQRLMEKGLTLESASSEEIGAAWQTTGNNV
jgi:MazG family protein